MISGVEQPSVKEIARDCADRVGAKLLILNDDIALNEVGRELIIEYGNHHLTVEVPCEWPRFQRRNAALAIVAAQAAEPAVELSALGQGLRAVHLPGRFELFQESRRSVVLDGAHNRQKIFSTVERLRHTFPAAPCVGVVAIKEKRDVHAILSELAPACQALVLTTFRVGLWKATPPEELAAGLRAMRYRGKVLVEPDPTLAIEVALHEVPATGVVLVTGSLCLAGNIRSRWIPPLEDVLHGTSFRLDS